jgi:hypothetical protein
MIKIMAVLLTTVTLAGCASTPLLRTQEHVVFVPDQSKFRCDTLTKLPKPDGLSDADVAKLIATLYTYNKNCYMTNKGLLNALNAASLEINKGGRINGKFIRKYRLAH